MSKVVEPPVLLSKTLTFVLAASIAVLATLAFTLYNMAPLTRPEIFFLRNQNRYVNYVLTQPEPETAAFRDAFEIGFIRTYITARNSLDTPKSVTFDRWNSIVKPWSSASVYDDFTKTDTYKDLTDTRRYMNIVCSVSFDEGNIAKQSASYQAKFTRTCFDQNSGRQIGPKSYKIRIAIQSYLDNESGKKLSYLEGLRNNPLGIQVTEYKVLDADGTDPLSDIETDFYKEGI